MLRFTKCLYKLAKPKLKKKSVNDLIMKQNMDEAIKTFEYHSNSSKIDLFSYSTIIKEYLQKGELPKALETFYIASEKEQVFPIEVYNHLIEKLMEKKDQTTAEQVYGILFQLGVEPNEETYFKLLLGYIHCHEKKKVYSMLEKITELNYVFTQQVYEGLIKFYKDLKKYEKMLKLVETMDYEKIPKTSGIFQCLIEYKIEKKDIGKAIQYIEDMHSLKMKPVYSNYYSVIDYYVNVSNNLIEARKWLNKMKKRGLKQDNHVYSIIINKFMKEAKFSSVEKYLNIMISEGVKPATSFYNQLLNVYINNQDKFDQIIEDMEKNKIEFNDQTKSILERVNKKL